MVDSVEEPNDGASGRRYVALIGDIQGSQQADDRARLQERFEEAVDYANAAVEHVNEFYESLPETGREKLVSPMVVTAGDEFQGLFGGPQEAAGAVSVVADWMAPWNLRFGLGLGPLETPVNPDQAIGMDGPCLRRAREALDQAKADDGWLRTRGFGEADRYIGRVVDPIGVLRERWTPRQAEFVHELRRHGTQKEVAQALDVSESTVSESLAAAAYGTIRDAHHALTGLLHTAARWGASTGGETR